MLARRAAAVIAWPGEGAWLLAASLLLITATILLIRRRPA
jgi:hypothetical protein